MEPPCGGQTAAKLPPLHVRGPSLACGQSVAKGGPCGEDGAMIDADLIVRNAAFVATCTRHPTRDGDLGIVERGAVAVRGGEIVWVGPEAQLPFKVRTLDATRHVDAQGGFVAPGYVDAHTHLVFAGDRAREFSLRCGGASYQELL